MRVSAKVASCFMLAALVMSCGDDEDTGTNPVPGGPTVTANASNQFLPATLDVAVGASVTWLFGPVSHDVKFSPVAGAPTDIGITDNANVSRTFSTAGVFPYICTLHSGMNGTVRVGQ
jgi:plastocyanin